MRAATASVQSDEPGLIFETASFDTDVTVVGPVAATLCIKSTTADADLFLVLDAIDPTGNRVELRDHRGGITAMTVGWQRASQRAVDESRSKAWQPYHPHRRAEPLVPGEPYDVAVELRPTSLDLPAGSRLRLTVRGHGPAHDDKVDRPEALFANRVTVLTGPNATSHLLIPIIIGDRSESYRSAEKRSVSAACAASCFGR